MEMSVEIGLWAGVGASARTSLPGSSSSSKGAGREEEVMGKGKMRDKAETEAKGEHPPVGHMGRALGGLSHRLGTSLRTAQKASGFNLLDLLLLLCQDSGTRHGGMFIPGYGWSQWNPLLKQRGCSLPWAPQLWPLVLQSITAGGCPGAGRGWVYCSARRQRIRRVQLWWGFASLQSSGEEMPVVP